MTQGQRACPVRLAGRRDSSWCRERWRRSGRSARVGDLGKAVVGWGRIVMGVGRLAHAWTHGSATQGRESDAVFGARTAGTR